MQGNIVRELDLSDELDVDRDAIRAENKIKTLKSQNDKRRSISPEYRRALRDAGLGDVIESFVKEN